MMILNRLCFAAILFLLLACEPSAGTPAFASTASASASAVQAPVASAPAPSQVPSSEPSAPAPRELETVDDEPDAAEPSAAAKAACAPKDPTLKPLDILRFAFTDSVEGKDARVNLSVARPGQRVHTHIVLRNRSGRERCITIELRVNGKSRTTLTQKVGRSWSWRTWGYNTLRQDDRGKLEAIVRDDQGKELQRRELPIVPAT